MQAVSKPFSQWTRLPTRRRVQEHGLHLTNIVWLDQLALSNVGLAGQFDLSFALFGHLNIRRAHVFASQCPGRLAMADKKHSR